jgi:predicted flap endonuclease-1-like 5' DNA nuclease
MTYLLVKYTLLFLLAAVLGFILGYWYSRRNFEDVSESFEDLRNANQRSDEQNWERLWSHLRAIPEPPETDLTDVYKRLDSVTTAVSLIPKPEPVDFQPLLDRLTNIEKEVKTIPVPEKPAPVDLSSVTAKVEALQAAFRSIPKPEPQADVDLRPVQSELSTLREEVRQIPVVETHAPVDLAPVNAQIRSLEQRIKSISQPQTVDLGPVDRRLQAIESDLVKIGKRVARPIDTERATRRERQRVPKKESREEPRILKAALYGEKDNLKMISGVGPKLENLLNKNGVYYFWQVAEWNRRDIDIIDERLDVFKGRIERDEWVKQADRLRRDPNAARMPVE